MEYFICANSFAAPFFSDTSTKFQVGNTPEEALEVFVKEYDHPFGLYAAALYEDANHYYKNGKALLQWMSNHAKFMENKTGMIYSAGHGRVKINGKMNEIVDPKGGSIVI